MNGSDSCVWWYDPAAGQWCSDVPAPAVTFGEHRAHVERLGFVAILGRLSERPTHRPAPEILAWVSEGKRAKPCGL